MKPIQVYAEKKHGSKWVKSYESTEPTEIYKGLMHDLIHKKLEGCTYIKSIKRTQNYDGTLTITVNYIGDVRRVYTIEDH